MLKPAAAAFALLCVAQCQALDTAWLQPTLGPPPTAPQSVAGLPGGQPRPLDTTGGFSVTVTSREQVRDFYNAVFTASENIPMETTAVTASCAPGTNATAFDNAVLRRINWFRTMAGVPARVIFSATESTEDQAAALMMSANGALQHTGIPSSWSCFTTNGTNAAANSNLALGSEGADAITQYMQDAGSGNYETGHRRWIVYPQTQVMATGDVPAQGTDDAANATWVFDANYGGPRPAGTAPFVSWPPPGYTPYDLVFPQWSFGLSNADLSAASVSMKSNGVPVSVTIQPYRTGYGEDTLVWYPTDLDPTSSSTVFPFSGADTAYSVTISNAQTSSGTVSITYDVTVFDPAIPGTDYVATVISGPAKPSVNENNLYSCVALSNPGLTGYQWLVSQATNGNLTDKATGGLTNFTVTPTPIYSVITNPPVGSGSCFHLTHTNPAPQLMQMNELLLPGTNTTLSFESLLGYATTNEIARVQASTNGGTVWWEIFTETGSGGAGDTNFTAHTFSLSNCAGCVTLLRFNYDFTANGGSYYAQTFNDVGWCLENIVLTNAIKLVNFVTNATASANFLYVPATAGSYGLTACGVLFGQFAMDLGPVATVTAITNAVTAITLGPPQLAGSQVEIPFTQSQGAAATFHLLQAPRLTGPWTTNTGATLTTNLAGALYQFTATSSGSTTFYCVRAP
jgi:hypothetical protein